MSRPTEEQIYQAREVCINKQRDKILEHESKMREINELNEQGKLEEAKTLLSKYMDMIEG